MASIPGRIRGSLPSSGHGDKHPQFTCASPAPRHTDLGPFPGTEPFSQPSSQGSHLRSFPDLHLQPHKPVLASRPCSNEWTKEQGLEAQGNLTGTSTGHAPLGAARAICLSSKSKSPRNRDQEWGEGQETGVPWPSQQSQEGSPHSKGTRAPLRQTGHPSLFQRRHPPLPTLSKQVK